MKVANTKASTLTKSREGEDMELSERKRQILSLAIEEYIKDSCPITSGGVSEHFKVSTATLRNELSALEAMGFLKQLHTSGGRVPTAMGYRFYVENMLSSIHASEEELARVQKLLENRSASMVEMVSSIAKIISNATDYPTVVLLSGVENLVLCEFKIVKLLGEQCMVLIGTTSGYISDTIKTEASQDDCKDVSERLTQHFKGETIGYMLDNISSIAEGMQNEISNFGAIISGLIEGLKKLRQRKVLTETKPISKLLTNDVQSATKVLELLENENKLAEKIETSADDITVDIADGQCSVVKAPIAYQGNKLACIGVLGPQNMDYAKIAGALKVISECLNKGDENV